jgi:hypothetical protein
MTRFILNNKVEWQNWLSELQVRSGFLLLQSYYIIIQSMTSVLDLSFKEHERKNIVGLKRRRL